MGASRAAAGGSGDGGGLVADGLSSSPPLAQLCGTAAEGVASGLSRSFQAAREVA